MKFRHEQIGLVHEENTRAQDITHTGSKQHPQDVFGLRFIGVCCFFRFDCPCYFCFCSTNWNGYGGYRLPPLPHSPDSSVGSSSTPGSRQAKLYMRAHRHTCIHTLAKFRKISTENGQIYECATIQYYIYIYTYICGVYIFAFYSPNLL